MIIVAAGVAHRGALKGVFHYDDFHTVVTNPAVRAWDPIGYFLSSKTSSGWFEGTSYRPVTVTTLALNVLVGGMNAGHFLLVNMILHTVIAWLIYVIGRRLLDDYRWAAVAALAFAIHPVNAEAVNYVVARSSLLSSVLTLVAVWALLRRGEGMRAGLAIAVAAYSLALLSKESAIALLPPVLCMGWLNQRYRFRLVPAPGPSRGCAWLGRRDVRVDGTFLTVTAAFVVLWRWMGAETLQAPLDVGAAYPLWTFLEIMVRGLWLWVWPWPLGLDHPIVFAQDFDAGLAAICVGTIGLILGFMAWSLKREPVVAWTVLWSVSGFLPLLPLPWLTSQALFQENRLSFTVIGLAWLTAWFGRAVSHWVMGHVRRPLVVQRIGIGFAGLLVLGAVAVDRSRSWVWNDDARLWEEVVRRRVDDPIAFGHLGSVYYVRGALDPAERAFRRALAIDPDSVSASLSLGLIAMQRGKWDDAGVVFTSALDRWNHAAVGSPDRPRQLRRGSPHDAQKIRLALAAIYLRGNDFERAQELYQEATSADATDFRAWYNLGVVAEQRGLAETARDAYRRALALSPNETQIVSALRRLDNPALVNER
jgi:tetratricopeptide (TPR) repeat protein